MSVCHLHRASNLPGIPKRLVCEDPALRSGRSRHVCESQTPYGPRESGPQFGTVARCRGRAEKSEAKSSPLRKDLTRDEG